MTKRVLNWRPDPRLKLAKRLKSSMWARITAPKEWENVQSWTNWPIEDQQDIGSCTGFGGAYQIEWRDLQDGNYKPRSKLFAYYNNRLMQNTVNEDSGAYITDILDSMKVYGLCHEELWPYITWKFKDKPPASAYDEADEYQVLEWQWCEFADLMAVIAAGNVVCFGSYVFDSIFRVGADGKLPPLLEDDKLAGGHCMTLTGYRTESDGVWFHARNQWGSYGDNGTLWIHEDYLRMWGSDYLVVTRVETIDAEAPTPGPDPDVPPDPTPIPPEPIPPIPDPAPEPRKCVCAGLWRKLGWMK